MVISGLKKNMVIRGGRKKSFVPRSIQNWSYYGKCCGIFCKNHAKSINILRQYIQRHVTMSNRTTCRLFTDWEKDGIRRRPSWKIGSVVNCGPFLYMTTDLKTVQFSTYGHRFCLFVWKTYGYLWSSSIHIEAWYDKRQHNRSPCPVLCHTHAFTRPRSYSSF